MILPTGKLLVNGFLIFNNTFTIEDGRHGPRTGSIHPVVPPR
jgi:hypothetical protein